MCPLSVAALKGHKDIVIHLIEEKCANIDFKINVSNVKYSIENEIKWNKIK